MTPGAKPASIVPRTRRTPTICCLAGVSRGSTGGEVESDVPVLDGAHGRGDDTPNDADTGQVQRGSDASQDEVRGDLEDKVRDPIVNYLLSGGTGFAAYEENQEDERILGRTEVKVGGNTSRLCISIISFRVYQLIQGTYPMLERSM